MNSALFTISFSLPRGKLHAFSACRRSVLWAAMGALLALGAYGHWEPGLPDGALVLPEDNAIWVERMWMGGRSTVRLGDRRQR